MSLHFDLLARSYDRLIPPPAPERLANLLGLPTSGWLLDMGGGTGRVAATLRPMVGRLVISDLSVPMLTQAVAKGIACAVQAEAEGLPFPDGHFERILVVDALHHFADQRRAIGELLRVLHPGGRLVIEEPDIGQIPVKAMALAEKLALMGSRFYAPDQIAAMAARDGFTVAVEHDRRFSAWVIVDRRP